MIFQLVDFSKIIFIILTMQLQVTSIKYLKTLNYYRFSMEIDAIFFDHTAIIYRLNQFFRGLGNAGFKFIHIQKIIFTFSLFLLNLNY